MGRGLAPPRTTFHVRSDVTLPTDFFTCESIERSSSGRVRHGISCAKCYPRDKRYDTPGRCKLVPVVQCRTVCEPFRTQINARGSRGDVFPRFPSASVREKVSTTFKVPRESLQKRFHFDKFKVTDNVQSPERIVAEDISFR